MKGPNKGDLYECAMCHKTFRATWSDEEALDELKENFGDLPGVPLILVCDTCYKRSMSK